MICLEASGKLSSFLDDELSPRQRMVIEEHLAMCKACRRELEELTLIQGALSGPEELSEIGEGLIWQGVRTRLDQDFLSWTLRFPRSVASCLRDLDYRFVWSKVAAAPLVFVFFALLSSHFPRFQADELSFSAIRMAAVEQDSSSLGRVFTLEAIQSRSSTNDLMETIWKIPYEDSLSLVAEVRPDGYLQVDSVLEYPRNPALLQVIDDNLRTSQFVSAGFDENPLVIYSFQKVDVYEEEGL